MEVTVALVGDPDRQGDPLGALEEGEGTPYAELRAVTFDVSLDDTLSEVLRRASRELGVTGPSGGPIDPGWISFYQPAHQHGYSTSGESVYLTLVDNEGRALWGVRVSDPRATMDALRRAQEAGLIDGDVSRPYLLLKPTAGNGVLFDWATLVQGYELVRESIGVIADVGGTVAVAAWAQDWVRGRARRILDRMRRSPDVIKDKTDDWTERNGWPYGIDNLLRKRLWTSGDLARLLNMPSPDVEALLTGRGMVKDHRTGYWHLGDDIESRITNEVYRFTLEHEWSSINEAGEVERVRTEIQRIVMRGMENYQ